MKKSEVSIEQKKPSTALSQADELRLHRSGLIVGQLTKLAAMMGEPMDSGGVRFRLMAEELSDLPQDSVKHAITTWLRGDTSHLSNYQQDHARIGVFFPKTGELREIAAFHLREHRQRDRDRNLVEQLERDSRHRREHPEEYFNLADLVRDVAVRTGRLDMLPPDQPVKHGLEDPSETSSPIVKS